jgi:hypothetical protein
VSEVTDDQADRLFAAGCDDGTPASCKGLAWIHFDREASSLEEAIGTAVAQVQSAGFSVSKIQLDVDAAVSLGGVSGGRTSNGRKPFRFLWNQSAALASNLYLLLFPKGPLQAALRTDSQRFFGVFHALRMIDTDAFIRV